MTTLLGLQGVLNRHVERVKRDTNKVTKEVARTVLKSLTEKTPVDTSQAISNWQVGIMAPIIQTKGPILVGSRGSTYVPSSHQAYVIGNSVLMLRHFGEPIFISNHLDYIEDLNVGNVRYRSGQLNPNTYFVEDAIDAGKVKLASLTP